LDVEEMLLSHDGTSVVLEPKVLAVLLYLYDNHTHYVTMEDLHNNVWRDRIVSDAAIRRTISKLRTLFDDDHKNPSYIKSLPTRGYKLVCPVSVIDSCTDRTTLIQDSIKNSRHLGDNLISAENISGGNQASLQSTYSASAVSRHRTKGLYLLLITALLLWATINSTLYFSDKKKPHRDKRRAIVTEVIDSLPGEKRALALSPNEQYIAFTGQVGEQSGYQIHLKKQNYHEFLPITQDAHLPLGLAFSADNKTLFYSDYKDGNSSLSKIILTDAATYNSEKLVQGYVSVGNVFTSPDLALVYFAGQKLESEPMFIYSYNTETRETKRVTSSTQRYNYDSRGAITPDGKMMAVLRISEYDSINEVRVIDLVNNNVIYRHQQSEVIYDIKWLDNENIVMLDEEKLIKINHINDKTSKLIEAPHNLAYLTVKNKEHVLAVNRTPPKKLFFEQSLPINSGATQQIFKLKPDIYFMAYQLDNDYKVILFSKNNINTLAQLNIVTNEITPYIETEHDLSIITSTSSDKLLLIKINQRFALFNSETKELRYITSGEDFIGDATFSEDQKSVLFSVKNYDQWEILNYDITTESITPMFKNFRYIRTHGKNYILGTPEQELIWKHHKTDEKIKLNHRLSYEPNTYWYVRGDSIFWSSHDLVQTTFHQLDVSDLENPSESKITFDYDKVRSYFSINHDGTAFTYFQRQQGKSDIVSIPFR
jgi:DNA-binding winged helix-turn-helix (wHTH) protein